MSSSRSGHETRLRRFGRWFIAPFYAIGSGVITTVAFAGIAVIASLPLWWLIPILAGVFLAETAVSIFLFKDPVPNTLVALFINGIFTGLSPIKKIILGFGIFAALGGGLALGALTYTSGVVAMGAVLGLASLSFPPFAIAFAAVLAVVAFVAFTGLLVDWIKKAIEKDIHLVIIDFFKKIFTRDESKSLTQQILEGSFKLFFTLAIVAITVIGTIATLGTMHKGLIKFLSLIPNANMLAVKISGGIIAYALMGIARLPFIMQSVCSVFSFLGEKLGLGIYRAGCAIGNALGLYSPPAAPEEISVNENTQSSSLKSIGIALLKGSAVLVHGVAFGALAKSGGGEVISDIMTDMHIPLDPVTIDTAGQVTSMVTGGMMAGGVGGFSLFKEVIQKPPIEPRPLNEYKDDDWVNSPAAPGNV